jgi:hypothetical protein
VAVEFGLPALLLRRLLLALGEDDVVDGHAGVVVVPDLLDEQNLKKSKRIKKRHKCFSDGS